MPAAMAHSEHGPIVLIVDDEPAIRQMLAEVLGGEGHRVVTAIDGLDAMDRLRDGLRPCLILLDLMMPRMNGWQFAERLRQDPELSGIPFIVIAANPRYQPDAARLGARGWLGKPLELDDLLTTVAESCIA